MKQFGKILKFELKNYLTNKTFVGVTAVLVLVIAAVMFYPRVTGAFEQKEAGEESAPILLVFSEEEENRKAAEEVFSATFTNYEVRSVDTDLEDMKEQIVSGEVECAFVLHNWTSYTYYVNNLSMYDRNTMLADEMLQGMYRMNAMEEKGMSQEEATTILTKQMESHTEKLGKDQMQNFFYTYIMIFALYMVILLYGQMVATNVASEKSSRAMEVLITSAKPVSMMFGKVIASCLAGLFQIVAVFGSALLFYHLNKGYWGENAMIQSLFGMPADLFGYMLVFFVLGFLIYAFMFGAVGSTASKLEDINTSVMPITLLFIAGFLVVVFSMSNGSVDTTLMKICSFVPFTSPMAMFTRIAMTAVPMYEILISILLLIVSVIGVGIVSAKIYRVGVLLYGTTPKFRSIMKAVRKV